MLRALGPWSADPRLRVTLERALVFLERCAAPGRQWAYRFWPEDKRPPRLPVLPGRRGRYRGDISLELARHGQA